MDLAHKTFIMEIIIEVIILMGCLKVLASIHGQIKAIIKVTLSRGFEVAMGIGKQTKIKILIIMKGLIIWIKNRDMGHMCG